MAAGIIFILAIEFTQLKTNSGVFDVDDIFNNSIGILIGYCTIMSVLNIRKGQKNRFSKALKYTLPLFIMTIIFAGMVIYYNTKEFGILKLPGYIKMNTKNVDIKFETGLDSGEYMIPIYKAPDFTNVIFIVYNTCFLGLILYFQCFSFLVAAMFPTRKHSHQ